MKVGSKIQGNIYVSAISNGLLSTMPLMMVGAVGSILNQLNIGGWQDFLTNTGLKTFTALPSNVGTNLMAIFAVFVIAYRLAKSLNKDGLTAGVLSLMAFLFLTPLQYTDGNLTGIPSTWLGATGLFVAMIVGILTARVYAWFIDKNIVIKMPEGVPPVIERTFASILPALAIAFAAIMISYGFTMTSFGSFHQFIYSIVSIPLTKLSGSFPALVIAVLAAQLFWSVGIHGTMVTLSVFMALWAPLDGANLAAYNAGQPAVSIVCMQFFFLSAFAGGAGNTLALILNMLTSKVKSNKTLGKLAFVPGLFGINEPIIFGLPIVLNTTLMIPFIGAPVICTILGYLMVKIGLLAAPTGISSIAGAPIIVSQFLMNGWTWAVWEIVVIVLSYFVYRPFFKTYERQQLAEMTEESRDENVEDIAKEFAKATK
jgi:PTS system cellobiose-specific IIC component